MCAGDQCCPGYAGSGGATFPCPSASRSFSGCVNNTKVADCLAGAAMQAKAQEGEQCGSSGSTGYFHGDCADGLVCVPPAAGSLFGAQSICHRLCGSFGASGDRVDGSCADGQACSGRAAVPCREWAGECYLYCPSSSTVVTTTSTTSTTSSSGPGCVQLSGTYCGGQGQECNCNYCDDFCQDTACARTCRVLNGYFSAPAQSTCQWSAAYVTNPSPDASGTSCGWMEGNGQGGKGDDCRECDQFAAACRRANPSGNCRA
ncbi:unnamed protein product [Prorocentrum cordatum]|nr:unnamed protein product [Polarella glacialis]